MSMHQHLISEQVVREFSTLPPPNLSEDRAFHQLLITLIPRYDPILANILTFLSQEPTPSFRFRRGYHFYYKKAADQVDVFSKRVLRAKSQEAEQVYKLLLNELGNEKRFRHRYEIPRGVSSVQIQQWIRTFLTGRNWFGDQFTHLPLPTQQQLEAIYFTEIYRYRLPPMVHAAHIVKHRGTISKEKAYELLKEARERIGKGEPFADVCREYSDCPNNGGDLGWFYPGVMLPRFEEVVFNLPLHEVSEIFETEMGFHIAIVYEKKDASIQLLEHVREDLLTRWRYQNFVSQVLIPLECDL